MPQRGALSKNMLSCPFRIVFFGVFLPLSLCVCVCVCVCVAFRIGFCSVFCHLSTFCTSRLRLAFVFQLCAGVLGGDGGGGVMTSMRLRLVLSFCFVDLLLLCCGAVQWWRGGGDDVHANPLVILMLLMSQSFWWPFQDTCCLTFHTSTMQKPRDFAAFQTKTSQLTLKLNQKTRKAWYLRHFRKNATKKQ